MFGCKINFRVHSWEQNTETEKTNDFWSDMVNQNKIFSFKIKRQVKNIFPNNVKKTVNFVPINFNSF